MVQTTKVNSNGNAEGTAKPSFPFFSNRKNQVNKLTKILLFLSPALIIYSLFMAIPLILSLKISLYQTTGVAQGPFVGLENYKTLFTNPTYSTRFFNALSNNIQFFLYTMLFQNVVGLGIALILNKELRFFNVIRTILFIPVTMSVLLIGFVWTLILNPTWGSLNYFLTSIGFKSWALPWLGDTRTALIAIAVVNAWQFIGLPIMMFLAGLQSIPKEYYEAAQIDGASAFHQFRHITVPHLLPVLGMVTILTLVGNFSSFELIYSMEGTMAGPNYSTDVLGTLFYRTAFGSTGGVIPNLGIGAAIASITFFIVLIIVCIWLYLTVWRSRD